MLKGVSLNDNYIFILISKYKKYNDCTKTDGLYLYYINDYENNPVIIINSPRFAGSRGLEYDEMLTETFKLVFSSVIHHINCVIFTKRCDTKRLDIVTKYAFSSIIGLISEDFS